MAIIELPIEVIIASPSAPGKYFNALILKVGKINSGKPLGTSPINNNPYFSKSNKQDKIPVTKTRKIEVGNLGRNIANRKRKIIEIKNNNVVFNFNSCK